MRILVAYSISGTLVQTTIDYLNAFSKYIGSEVDYLNVTHGSFLGSDLARYDAVINNYCARLIIEGYVSDSYKEALKTFGGIKILGVQDEYDRTNILRDAIKELGFHVVLTCVPQDEIEYVYPRAAFENVRFETVFTGYVPDHLAGTNHTITPLRERSIVVGYRGRDIGGLYGRLGFEKYEIGRHMKEACTVRGIPHDISIDEESRIYGPAWFDFVGSCRAMLGSESGSNVFDFDGSLQRTFNEMTEANGGRRPTYQEFQPFVAQRDSEISMGQISPRVFECAVMKTPMVLFRGRYSDALEPDTHYLPLEKDFSNIDEVFAHLEQLDKMEAMAERTHEHLVGSGQYGYCTFMNRLGRIIDEEVASKATRPASSEIVLHSTPDGLAPWLVELPTSAPKSFAAFYLAEKKKLFKIYSLEVERMTCFEAETISHHRKSCAYYKQFEHLSDDVTAYLEMIERAETFFSKATNERQRVVASASGFLQTLDIEEMDQLLAVYEPQVKSMYAIYDEFNNLPNSITELEKKRLFKIYWDEVERLTCLEAETISRHRRSCAHYMKFDELSDQTGAYHETIEQAETYFSRANDERQSVAASVNRFLQTSEIEAVDQLLPIYEQQVKSMCAIYEELNKHLNTNAEHSSVPRFSWNVAARRLRTVWSRIWR